MILGWVTGVAYPPPTAANACAAMTLVTLSGRVLGPHADDVRALGPTRRRTATGDGGVGLGVLRVAGVPGVGRDWDDAVLTNQIFRHPPDEPPLLWFLAGS